MATESQALQTTTHKINSFDSWTKFSLTAISFDIYRGEYFHKIYHVIACKKEKIYIAIYYACSKSAQYELKFNTRLALSVNSM